MTEKQKRIFEFIRSFYRKNHRMPTLKEIADRFRFSSTSTVSEYLKRLEEQGYLKKTGYGKYEIADEYNKTVIPYYGEVSAGRPISIYDRPLDYIELPIFDVNDDWFALKVKGDSMIEDGILNGDLLIVKPTVFIDNGQTAVVVIDEDSSTVKKVFDRGEIVELRPANYNLSSMYYEKHRVRIVGVIKKLIRDY